MATNLSYNTAGAMIDCAHRVIEDSNYANNCAFSESNLIAMEDMFVTRVSDNTVAGYLTSSPTPQMAKYEVGQKIQTCTDVISDDTFFWMYESVEEYRVVDKKDGVYRIELIKSSPAFRNSKGKIFTESYCFVDNNFIPIPSFLMNIVETARNLRLPADEKLYRKVGLKDKSGVWTQEAIQSFVERLMDIDASGEGEDIIDELADELDEEMGKKSCDC